MSAIRRYRAAWGAGGGRIVRRTLTPDDARAMVRVREARRAFHRHRARCFWSYRPDLVITAADVHWVAEQLMRHGDRAAYRAGARLCH
ncbi:MAG: hypothetical protein WD771_04830 [Gemmatimonadaceae bacterium]